MTDEPYVVVARDGGVQWITINRPETRNALEPALAGALVAAIESASVDDSVRVVVLTGAGSAFCAGARLDGLAAAAERGDADGVRAGFGAVESVFRAIIDCRQPTIAMVNGPALAGGCGIVTACDVAFASDRAVFGYPEVLLGLAPGMVMALLFHQAGFRGGLELCLTGRRFGPDEALALGLINRVVPAAELESSVADFAADLAKLPPGALATIKRTAWTLADMDLDRGLRYARDVSSLRALTDEARAGIEGFLKRAAR